MLASAPRRLRSATRPPSRGGVSRVLGPSMTAGFLVALLAGCGLGAGPAPSAVHLTVTRGFGASLVRSWSAPRVVGQETAMSLLTRNATVKTRYGGGFVESVDGLSGGEAGGQPSDWFYYVNGVEAPKGAAATNIHPGDHIWWDLHDWSQTDSVPAVVGSFPEPFLNGIDGKRLPVRIECAVVPGYACRTVTARLRALGVPAAIAAIGSGGEPETLRVVVGPWLAVRGDPSAQSIEHGPSTSGVYARFSSGGQTLTLLNERGVPARTLTARAGLVAATRHAEDAPVWMVTGTDSVGVELAARAFNVSTLQNRFALVVAPGGAALAAPATDGG
jgi:hypothetical protein